MMDDDTEIRRWLASQPVESLAEILERLIAAADERARRLILMRMAASDGAPDLARLRRLIELAIVPRAVIRHAAEYAHGRSVDDAVDLLRDLLRRGLASEARDLCIHAMACCDRAFESVDEGIAISDAYHELVDLHLAACRMAPPARGALAAWLADEARTAYTDAVVQARAAYERLLREG
jgi:hypothetical protein